jgi:tRNA(His) 5'-end guanylyltransferase
MSESKASTATTATTAAAATTAATAATVAASTSTAITGALMDVPKDFDFEAPNERLVNKLLDELETDIRRISAHNSAVSEGLEKIQSILKSSPDSESKIEEKPKPDLEQKSDPRDKERKSDGKQVQVVETLGDRMKLYELALETSIPGSSAYIVRLDGVSFSTFTRGLDPVFDMVFTRSIILTMNDLVQHFHAVTGYCHSDEITLVFPPVDPTVVGAKHLYAGRVQKLVSVLSSCTAARFNYHFAEQIRHREVGKGVYKSTTYAKMHWAYFDARVLAFPNDRLYEVVNHMIWRSKFDCYRNCVSAFGRQFFSSKQLDKVNCTKMIADMKTYKGFDFATVPCFLRHGVVAKRSTTGVKPAVEIEGKQKARTVIENRCCLFTCNEVWTKTMLSKMWPTDAMLPLKDPVIVPTFYKAQITELTAAAAAAAAGPTPLPDPSHTVLLQIVLFHTFVVFINPFRFPRHVWFLVASCQRRCQDDWFPFFPGCFIESRNFIANRFLFIRIVGVDECIKGNIVLKEHRFGLLHIMPYARKPANVRRTV